MHSFSDVLSAAACAQLVLVTGAPRTGIAVLAGQLAAHPDALLLDGSQHQGLDWLTAFLCGSDQLNAVQQRMEAALHEIHGPAPGHAPSHLIVPVEGLLPNSALQSSLLRCNLTRSPRIVMIRRSRADTLCSLARFPHLHPDLPDPYLDQEHFIEAADKLLSMTLAQANDFRSRCRSAGYTWLNVSFDDLARTPDRNLSQLRNLLGLRPLKRGEFAPKRGGISRSLCCRERQLDASSVGRGQRLIAARSSVHNESRDLVLASAEPCRPPLILTGRGGSGTRLLAEVCLSFGINLGTSLNRSLDSLQWVDLMYEIALADLSGHATPWRGSWAEELLNRARWHRLPQSTQEQPWGFKLPEAMLVGHVLMEAWPTARLVHLVRHPLDVCLRRTHMTSRTTNPIGLATLRAAYQALGCDQDPRNDPPHWRNAVSWWFQLSRMQEYSSRFADRILEVRYEDLCDHPITTVGTLAQGLHLKAGALQLQVDRKRRRQWHSDDSRVSEIWDLCGPIASKYGYTLAP